MKLSFFGATFLVLALVTISCYGAQANKATRSGKVVQASSEVSNQASAEDVLSQAKAAMGGAVWDKVRSLRTEATITIKTRGLSGTTTQLVDLMTGQAVTENHFGAVHTVWGFDGKATWMHSPHGVASTTDKPALNKMYRTRAYQEARAWWFPKRWPAKIRSAGRKSQNERTFDVLKITPKGANSFQLWIDAKTHLITRLVSDRGQARMVVYLSDYHVIDGIKVAFKRKTTVNGKTLVVANLRKATTNAPVATSDFAMPTHTAMLLGGAQRVTVPYKPISNWIYLPGKINGHPTHFLLDSNWGRTASVTPDVAKVVGLVAHGSRTSHVGAGSRAHKVQSTSAKTLVLANAVKLVDPMLNILSFPRLTKDIPARGFIGAQILDHFVTRINYAKHRVTFIEPDAFNPADAGTAVPLSMSIGGSPVVRGSIDGIPARFIVDTGNRGTLFLTSPFAKKHELYVRYNATDPVPTGSGAGGATRSRIARAGTLKIGSVVVHDPLVNLSMATKGAFASKIIDGDIGGRVLKRFTVTFDVPHHRLYLKPNKKYGKVMGESWYLNRAGLLSKKTKHGFTVTTVLPGSPAAQAGLAKGDLITAVNGQAAASMSQSALRNVLRNSKPGTRIVLVVSTGHATNKVALTLRRLLPKTGGLSKQAGR